MSAVHKTCADCQLELELKRVAPVEYESEVIVVTKVNRQPAALHHYMAVHKNHTNMNKASFIKRCDELREALVYVIQRNRGCAPNDIVIGFHVDGPHYHFMMEACAPISKIDLNKRYINYPHARWFVSAEFSAEQYFEQQWANRNASDRCPTYRCESS